MLEVTVLTSLDIVFKGQAHSVILPGDAGVFEVLPFHKRMLSRLLEGIIDIDGESIPILRGVVRIENNAVTAVVEQQ